VNEAGSCWGRAIEPGEPGDGIVMDDREFVSGAAVRAIPGWTSRTDPCLAIGRMAGVANRKDGTKH
jgi:hypothetical protein